MDKQDVVSIYLSICLSIYLPIYLSIYNGVLFSHKKNEILPFVDNLDGPRGFFLSEINQTEKGKYSMVVLTCGI